MSPPTVTLSFWLTVLGMFAAFIAGGAGITVLYHVLVRQRDPVRDTGIADLARRLGRSYPAADPFDLLRLPLELIRTGGQAMILNVISGEFRGMAITAFGYRRFSREQVRQRAAIGRSRRTSLLDPAVMGWFLTSPGDWNFEFYGSRLFCHSPLREVGQVRQLERCEGCAVKGRGTSSVEVP